MDFEKAFATFANKTAKATGSPWAFCLCVVAVVGWAVTGPIFKFSETWQLVINTGTTIITFLMVFLIQNTQNRDGAAIQAKLDNIILMSGAENEFIGIEKMTDKELEALKGRCEARAKAHAELNERVVAEHETRRGHPAKPRPAAKRSAKSPVSASKRKVA